MRVLIYSPSDTDEKVYKDGEKKFKDLGYEVFNPYDHKLDSESLDTAIHRLLLLVNMVVCVTPLQRRWGKVTKDALAIKNFCFHNIILFRIAENDKELHYTKWGKRKLRANT
jgi:hypothetical protein